MDFEPYLLIIAVEPNEKCIGHLTRVVPEKIQNSNKTIVCVMR